MRHGQSVHGEFRDDLLSDQTEYVRSIGMALVLQAQDMLAMVVVTDIAAEGHQRSGTVVIREPLKRLGIKAVHGDIDMTDCGHGPIIRVRGRSGTLRTSVTSQGVPMREVSTELLQAVNAGSPVAMATVVRTWRSAPRPAGAAMLVTETGEAVGSVSGGCVEGALFELGTQVLSDGNCRLQTYGVSDDDAFAVGLTCGGILDIFIERVDQQSWPEMAGVLESIAANEPVAVATIVNGPHGIGRHLVIRPAAMEGTLGSARLDEAVRDDVRGMLAAGSTGFLQYGPDGERLGEGLEIFVQSYAATADMFIFGAIDFSASLVRVGKLLGYKVTVCDARPVFATTKRFPDADAVVVDWPHRWLATQSVDQRTVIAVLTHDPKFDVPALVEALNTDAGYIGAMGSRRTHADRLMRLREAGVSEADLARIHSPIGLDLGARTPEETAISIAAEIIQQRWGGTGGRLRETQGPIHPGAPR